MPSYLSRDNKPTIAFNFFEGADDLPPVVFLGGFRSDMEGTKALYLEEKCRDRGQSYLRFDYRGHGQSGGEFEACTLTDWMADACEIMDHCLDRPAILVGSSMGGWITLAIAKEYPDKVSAIVGLAAAPDFTIWMEEKISTIQKEDLKRTGRFLLENDYGEPYVITKNLLSSGRTLQILHESFGFEGPIRLIQGKKDADVPWETAERIKNVAVSKNIEIIYIENGDHRLSSPDELAILNQTIESLISA